MVCGRRSIYAVSQITSGRDTKSHIISSGGSLCEKLYVAVRLRLVLEGRLDLRFLELGDTTVMELSADGEGEVALDREEPVGVAGSGKGLG